MVLRENNIMGAKVSLLEKYILSVPGLYKVTWYLPLEGGGFHIISRWEVRREEKEEKRNTKNRCMLGKKGKWEV